ncbi:thiamine phosphate synthase [Chitinivorax sp. PXF-14]|uniref:thiamine phosphate synthase n=1 Tax=Chitinivorax sp. PXF-14 TaxID=3230488 RepID=UPI0034652824
MPKIEGIYAITPDTSDTARLLAQVSAVLSGGVKVMQYRNKSDDADLRFSQAGQIKQLCDRYAVPLIINDDVELALAIDAAGVHLGEQDGSLQSARLRLGPHKLLGASCYASLALAERALSNGADHVAFGAVFPSITKPLVRRATLDLIAQARRQLSAPIVAIGGITAENGSSVVDAGADALAVISSLFDAADIEQAARVLSACFERG